MHFFSSVLECLLVSPTRISASLVPANETHLCEQNCHESQGCCVGDCLDKANCLLNIVKTLANALWSDLLRLEMRALND